MAEPIEPQGNPSKWADTYPSHVKLRKLPAGTMLGKPFRCFASGQVFCRYTGQELGPKGGWTPAQVHAMVAHFNSTSEPVGLDLDHMSFLGSGEAIGLWAQDETEGELAGHTSLWAIPAYNKLGMMVVSNAHGERLYTSPTITLEKSYDPRTGVEQPAGLIVSIALTFSPAQKQGGVVSQVEFKDKKGGQMAAKKKLEDPVKDQLPEGEAEIPEADLPIAPEDAEIESEGPEGEDESAGMAEGEAPPSEVVDEGDATADPESDCECPEGEECDCPDAEDAPDAEAPPVAMSAKGIKDLVTAELSALRKENADLRKTVLSLGAEKAINRLLSTGKITPAERESATRAYHAEYSQGAKAAEKMAFRPFSEVFAARDANSKVDYSVRTSARGRENNKLDAEVAAYSAANKVPYHVALKAIAKNL